MDIERILAEFLIERGIDDKHLTYNFFETDDDYKPIIPLSYSMEDVPDDDFYIDMYDLIAAIKFGIKIGRENGLG